MTSRSFKIVCRCLAQGVLGFSLVSTIYAAQPGLVAKVSEPVSVRSEFVDDAKIGKDPFFPMSARRQAVKDVPVTPLSGVGLKIKLGGVSGAKDNRLAIINNKTYAVGEEFEMKQDGQNFKIRIEEIKDHSVLININGVTRELTLGQLF